MSATSAGETRPSHYIRAREGYQKLNLTGRVWFIHAPDTQPTGATHRSHDLNVFRLLFDVHVNVEISREKPVAYRIVAVHDVTDAPDEDG